MLTTTARRLEGVPRETSTLHWSLIVTGCTSVDVNAVAARIAIECARPVEEFDVRIVNDADAVFLGNLMREGQRCYERNLEDRVAFEVQAHNAWLDYQPVWQRLRRHVLRAWSRG